MQKSTVIMSEFERKKWRAKQRYFTACGNASRRFASIQIRNNA